MMEKLHQSWESIMEMNFYDFQNLLESYSRILEARREEEEKEAKKQGYYSKFNTESYMKKNMPSVSLPKVNIPKL